MERYSEVYTFEGRLFRYDYNSSNAELLGKADENVLLMEKEWERDFNEPLFHIGADGLYVVTEIGFNAENWKNKAVRDEYLFEWIAQIEEDVRWLANW